MNPIKETNFKSQAALAGLLILIFGAFNSFYKIDQTEQGVVTRFGAFSHIAEAGAHFKLPFGIDEVYKVGVTIVHELEFGFRKNADLPESRARLESLMLTGDLNVAIVEWIVKYRISDPKKYLFSAVNAEKNIRDVSISVMRRVVGDKLVSDVLTKDRIQIAENAKKLTQETLDVFDMGILITTVALQNVTPPESVKPAYNDVNIARQEKEQMINEAQGIYNKVIPEAEGKSGKIISEAEAYAIDLVNRTEGDASKFKQMLAAYQKSPRITRKRLYLETMQEILSDPAKRITVVDANLKGILPLYNTLKEHEKIEAVASEHEKSETENESKSTR